MRRALLFGVMVACSGCWPRQVLIRPAGTLTARTADGAEVTGATFHVWRFNLKPEPPVITGQWRYDGDEHGAAIVSRETKQEWVSLLDESVHAWNVCVDAPGYRPVQLTWFVDEVKVPASVVNASAPLQAGSGSCDDPKFKRLWKFEAPE